MENLWDFYNIKQSLLIKLHNKRDNKFRNNDNNR
jgi:hypothetical protein